MMTYQLLRPLAYLTIHDASKWKMDWLAPAFIALPCVVGFLLLPLRPTIFLSSGLLVQFAGLLEILPGFYLAALAAIATFNRQDMDAYMPQPTPTLTIQVKGVSLPIKLTRRRMLSLQFGYLTLVSLILFIVTIVVNAVAPSAKVFLSVSIQAFAANAVIGVFLFLFAHLMCVTMLGLYQLSDRMHQPDQEV